MTVKRWFCSQCGESCTDEEKLTAPDPFTTDATITACPHCRAAEALNRAPETNTLPPVGATVEDADGTSYVRLGSWNAQRDEIEYCWAREVESLGTKGLVEVLEPSGLAAVLTASWRMQQERDQFKAELQTLRERVGDLEVDVAIGEGRGAIIDELTARVVELEAVRDQLATDLQGALESARNSGAAQDHMRLYGAETREERDRLKARVAKLEADAARYAYCRTGQWVRRSVSIGWDAATDSELMEERTFLEVPVLKGSDLSCRAWVDRAIDAARAAQGGA